MITRMIPKTKKMLKNSGLQKRSPVRREIVIKSEHSYKKEQETHVGEIRDEAKEKESRIQQLQPPY